MRAQDRLEKFLVDHVERAYLQYAFHYDSAVGSMRASSMRPDVVLKNHRAGPSKHIIWHETDEWDHEDRDAGNEVQREDRVAKDLLQGCGQLHLVRCSPYDTALSRASRRSGQHLDSPRAFMSVLESACLIVDILEGRQQAPDKTIHLSNGGTLFIYYLHYSADRQAELDLAREKYTPRPSTADQNAGLPAQAPTAAEGTQQPTNQLHSGHQARAQLHASAGQQRHAQNEQQAQRGTTSSGPSAVQASIAASETQLPRPAARASPPESPLTQNPKPVNLKTSSNTSNLLCKRASPLSPEKAYREPRTGMRLAYAMPLTRPIEHYCIARHDFSVVYLPVVHRLQQDLQQRAVRCCITGVLKLWLCCRHRSGHISSHTLSEVA